MADTSQWIRSYIGRHQDPAAVAARMSRLAAERGLPMAHPVPAEPGDPAGHAIIAHPDLQVAWDALAGGIRRKQVRPPQIRRAASGRVHRRGGA